MLDRYDFNRIHNYIAAPQHGTLNNPLYLAVQDFLTENKGVTYQYGYEDFNNLGDQALWISLDILLQSLPLALRPKGLLDGPSPPSVGRNEPINLVFPGGGSLGTRYHLSRWRVEMIEKMQPTGILQMPVSTSFADNEAVSTDRLRQAYAAPQHKRIFVRDERSLEEAASRLSIQAELMPDLSNLLPCMRHLHRGGKGTVYLIRVDQESSNEVVPPEVEAKAVDWDDEALSLPSKRLRLVRFMWRASHSKRLPIALRHSGTLAGLRSALARSISRYETARALCFLAQYDKVVTDRLHGVLLARKLGIPVFAADNDHGKISRYIQTWITSGAEDGAVAIYPSVKEACAAAK